MNTNELTFVRTASVVRTPTDMFAACWLVLLLPLLRCPVSDCKQTLPSSPHELTVADSGLDMDYPLGTYAAAWRQLAAELFIDFGHTYTQLLHGFFRSYRHQMQHNAHVIVSVVGIDGDVPALVRQLWQLGVHLWAGLRMELSSIEQELEAFLHYLANTMEHSLEPQLSSRWDIRQSLVELHSAIRSADGGYERNYERCRANYMRALRRQLNEMQSLHRKAATVIAFPADRSSMRSSFAENCEQSHANLNKVLQAYWSESISVFRGNWKRYGTELMIVLVEM